MSSSRSSLKRCFWRAFMIENAIAMVSSCISRLSSPSELSSPSMRSTGWLPTFRWRSDAFRSIAILSRSLMFIAGALLGSVPPVPARSGGSVGAAAARLAHGRQDFAGLAGFMVTADRGNREQPAVPVLDVAGDHAQELRRQPKGDLARASGADGDAVHRADGGDLGGGAGEEHLVAGVELAARDHLLAHLDAEVAGEGDDGVAGDARQQRGRHRRSHQDAALDDEEVLAGAFADVAAGVQGDALDEAVGDGLHLDQLRVEVVARRLGHGRQGARGRPPPRRDAGVHAILERLVAEVPSPGPGGDHDLDRRAERVHSHGAEAAVDQRPDVARLEAVAADRVHDGVADLRDGERQVHAIDLGGERQPVQVLRQPEDGGDALPGRRVHGVVAADALEDPGAIMQRMGQDMDRGLLEIDQLAVLPDPADIGKGVGRGQRPPPLGGFDASPKTVQCPPRSGRAVSQEEEGGSGEDGGLDAENAGAEGDALPAGGVEGLQLGGGPAAFGTYQEGLEGRLEWFERCGGWRGRRGGIEEPAVVGGRGEGGDLGEGVRAGDLGAAGAMALLDGGDGDAPQAVRGAGAEAARAALGVEEADRAGAELGGLLHQPGGGLGAQGGDQDLEVQARLVRRGGLCQLDQRRAPPHLDDLAPARVPLAVDHPQALADADPARPEQVAVGVALQRQQGLRLRRSLAGPAGGRQAALVAIARGEARRLDDQGDQDPSRDSRRAVQSPLDRRPVSPVSRRPHAASRAATLAARSVSNPERMSAPPAASSGSRSARSGRISSSTTLTTARSKGPAASAAARPAKSWGWRPLSRLLARACRTATGSASKATTRAAPQASAANARMPVPVPTSSTARPASSASSSSSSARTVDSWLPMPKAVRAGSRSSRRPAGTAAAVSASSGSRGSISSVRPSGKGTARLRYSAIQSVSGTSSSEMCEMCETWEMCSIPGGGGASGSNQAVSRSRPSGSLSVHTPTVPACQRSATRLSSSSAGSL